ncbi:putative mitochondrial otubain, putative,otubain cysteine peptidase, Clan CA, family C65 [Leptomonas pyrrhocoris]|uniref:ubiquitinyl hydrolase 1 n=1 Tax=Leptomonas pyrrhocoris TaxID=157538 RepID=A0A0M9FUM5_LEPPY|nr:putative mitochondrial otubain, putative,otubain cysteine peptidase, Clan CA, family C65 [Leptomonas pyrrhocoris]KPA76297.1 putative mitochondrial otubain, putative,otubain cysteine peptidase, Clan CA, family C65 [Leptomonas pyrrhocoris]|eukprot:XP_015654736.1 putative mitochondrial otubain, putative,otubain cysteine peptidase, Clan CA, family C65 [Leptomonas pyrrhocoris]
MEDNAKSPTAMAEACEAQLADIREEVRRDPLLSVPLPLDKHSRLVQEVKGDEAYMTQSLSLFGASATSTKQYNFTRIRYARRDGNCFYRCAGFRLCELIVQHPEKAPDFVARLKSLEPLLTAMFGDFVSDFTEVLMEVIQGVVSGKVTTTAQVYQRYTSDDGAYLIVALRYIVSAYLQEHEDDYLPFVEGLGYGTVKAYCNMEVEAVDHESDNVQLAAFAKVLDVCLMVYGLDRNAGANVTEYSFNDENNADGHRVTIELLYMPGHYNLLER